MTPSKANTNGAVTSTEGRLRLAPRAGLPISAPTPSTISTPSSGSDDEQRVDDDVAELGGVVVAGHASSVHWAGATDCWETPASRPRATRAMPVNAIATHRQPLAEGDRDQLGEHADGRRGEEGEHRPGEDELGPGRDAGRPAEQQPPA